MRGPSRSRLAGRDLLTLSTMGVATRPLRAALSGLGIALGIGALITIVGVSSSSHADLDAQLRSLGTDLLSASAGKSMTGEETRLPVSAVGRVSRIPQVTGAAGTGETDATVRRTDQIPEEVTGAIAVLAVTGDLRQVLSAHLESGRWLDPGDAPVPTVVLGKIAAQRLGINAQSARSRVFIGGRWFAVIGILAHDPLSPEVDRAVLVKWVTATELLGFDGHPTTVYLRSTEDAVNDVRDVLAASIDPEHPEQIATSRPSDALAAKQLTDSSLSTLLLILGGTALLIGGIGVANTMVVAVLERRHEIGLRRALGAKRRHILAQFLSEATVLSVGGGLAGAALGLAATAAIAHAHGWPVVIVWPAMALGLVATTVVGIVAGLYPATKAARQDPTTALSA